MTDALAEAYLKLYDLSPEDLETVRRCGTKLVPRLDRVVERFYEWLPRVPEYERFFPDVEATKPVQVLQRRYWAEFLEANLDPAYIESRQRVGMVHARIGLPLRTYFAAMDAMFSILVDELAGTEPADGNSVRALGKLIHLDTSIVANTFSEITNQTIRQQSEAIMAMSTPVTSIWDGVLLLPVVGLIDSQRAQNIMNAMLTRIRDAEGRAFILDISGVAAMDTAVANHLMKMTKAAKIMGCTCIISGVSPAIASTVVELGIDVSTIRTTANLKDALSLAFSLTGMRVIEGASSS